MPLLIGGLMLVSLSGLALAILWPRNRGPVARRTVDGGWAVTLADEVKASRGRRG